MHEAYEVIPILKKLPPGLFIETMSAFGNYLLVGTKSGALLYYQLVLSTQSKSSKQINSEYDVKLLCSNKSFSKKTISQIEVVPDFQMLICLADNTVTAFILDESSMSCAAPLTKTKGAHLFAVNISKRETSKGEVKYSLQLCVAIRKKLQLYYWNVEESKFLQFSPDMSLRDTPRTIVWCDESLCVGFKMDYCLIKTSSGQPQELFSTGGKRQEPLVTLLPGNKLAVGSDEQTVIIDSEGNPTLKYSIKWSEVPIALVHDAPYLIAVLPSSSIEVRAIEPRVHVQSISLQHARIVASSKSGWIFAASQSDVWLLRAVSFSEQILKLLEQNQLELALCMAKMSNDQTLRKKIENLHAFSLFRKRNFKEAMDIFLKLDTDPSHVIGLFPDLLPEEFRSQLEYPDQLPALLGTELENGIIALTTYLVQVRSQLMKDIENNSQPSMIAIVDGGTTIRSKKQLLQIIDTTLLKCYLQTNDALVASLLRMKDNYCHIEESERALKKHHKYSELIILYNKKEMHRQALDLLMRQAGKSDSPLHGHERTVMYLQQLGKEHLNLVFEYSRWVLKEHPEDGLKIFTEEPIDTKYFPVDEVYSFLCTNAPDLVISYLEHAVHVWKDESKIFHNSLIWQYCEKIRNFMKDYLISLPEGQPPAAPGKEPGELGCLRLKLLGFLDWSQHYTVETFAMHLQHDGLFEEAAVVLGRLGRHEEALNIYSHVLQDLQKAETYCAKHYQKDKPGDRDVYFVLLKLYLSSSDSFKLDLSSSGLFNFSLPEPNLDMALEVLTKYSAQIDPFKAIHILPADVPVSKLKDFLKCVLHQSQTQKHKLKLVKSLLSAENLKVQDRRIRCQSVKLIVSDLDICRVCQKRIGKSAFAYFPSGVIVHYSCKDFYSTRS